jgi:hypothetical protein
MVSIEVTSVDQAGRVGPPRGAFDGDPDPADLCWKGSAADLI